ncbi:MAG: ZIP family metal transporter [Gaiellales bacterium]
MTTSVWWVFVAALITALATGLGAVPFLFTRMTGIVWLGLANAIAAGVMLAASVGLVRESIDYSGWRTAVGAAVGVLLIIAVRRALHGHDHLEVGALHGVDARKAVMIVAVMTVHSFSEGVGVGVAYGGGEELGAFITAAIAVHNIPEGLAISLVLVPRGVTVLAAAGWSVLSSLPQPLMAVPAFLFVEAFAPLLPAGLGFAAGAMVYMVLAELVPEARAAAPARSLLLAGGAAFVLMTVFQEFVL